MFPTPGLLMNQPPPLSLAYSPPSAGWCEFWPVIWIVTVKHSQTYVEPKDTVNACHYPVVSSQPFPLPIFSCLGSQKMPKTWQLTAADSWHVQPVVFVSSATPSYKTNTLDSDLAWLSRIRHKPDSFRTGIVSWLSLTSMEKTCYFHVISMFWPSPQKSEAPLFDSNGIQRPKNSSPASKTRILVVHWRSACQPSPKLRRCWRSACRSSRHEIDPPRTRGAWNQGVSSTDEIWWVLEFIEIMSVINKWQTICQIQLCTVLMMKFAYGKSVSWSKQWGTRLWMWVFPTGLDVWVKVTCLARARVPTLFTASPWLHFHPKHPQTCKKIRDATAITDWWCAPSNRSLRQLSQSLQTCSNETDNQHVWTSYTNSPHAICTWFYFGRPDFQMFPSFFLLLQKRSPLVVYSKTLTISLCPGVSQPTLGQKSTKIKWHSNFPVKKYLFQQTGGVFRQESAPNQFTSGTPGSGRQGGYRCRLTFPHLTNRKKGCPWGGTG